jgi:pimeloyl-ACP methyl ester carboxylesterase
LVKYIRRLGKDFLLRSLSGPSLLLGLVMATGCAAPIGVLKVGSQDAYDQINANILTGTTFSTGTGHVLRRFDLEQQFQDSPVATLVWLQKRACEDTRRDLLFAIAELSYAQAAHAKQREESAYYLQSSIYAYLYLFARNLTDQLDPYDPRFRVGADLYNRALAQALSSEDGAEVILSSRSMPLAVGQAEVRIDRSGFPWGEDQYSKFLPADNYRVRGLPRYREPGLGVALIAVPPVASSREITEGKLPPALKIPATAFLRVLGDRCDVARGQVSASLELYSVFDATEIRLGEQNVPLEVDLTTPLAYSLERSMAWEFELGGFLGRFGNPRKTSGVLLLQPYQAGRIPVVFVHGTASSPARWAPMYNTLLSDPLIRRRYQFWVFIYPSGNPIAFSASLLRDSLKRVVHTADPNGDDRALGEMVIVGHSQGGLLTKMMVIEPGDRLWSHLSDKKLEDIEMPEKTRGLIRNALFFDPLPFVKRVIFISTPQHGSFVSKSWIGRFFAKMVSLPGDTIQISQSTLKEITKDLPPDLERKIPTSVDNMSPDNPFIIQLAQIPIIPGAKAHSIIAVQGDGPIEEGNDGVVEYKSAHIDGVESEFVVRSGHSAQGQPPTIEEVRRILLEHAAQTASPEAPAGSQGGGKTRKDGTGK